MRDIYHMTHIYNVPNMMRDGILSHSALKTKSPYAIYNLDIVDRRNTVSLPLGMTLWDYTNFYFQPRNPMLYQVTRSIPADAMAILAVRVDKLPLARTFVSSGNARSQFLSVKDAANTPWFCAQLKSVVNMDWWSDVDGSKRKIMMECLVPNQVPPSAIHEVIVSSSTTAESLKAMNVLENRAVVVNPTMFFEPILQISLTPNISIVQGDIFFSKMQTLAITVNTVGVMGKGLASTCKIRFPDAYVRYQSLCSTKTLTMGNPKLYKREASLDAQLANNSFFINTNAIKWFLFFPTKSHWKQNSYLEGIKKGMEWLANNYKKEGIESIALPALGCGLGNLHWRDVGPIMCRALARMQIKVEVYLPSEMSMPLEELTKEFLCGK